jgi:putative colanic acid biosynthesis acetyltransferase WcaF
MSDPGRIADFENNIPSAVPSVQGMDVASNRKARKWSSREQVMRVLWTVTEPAFRYSPRPAWFWRRTLLRLFGARVGKEVHIYPSVRITLPWNLTIGDYSAIGARALVYNLGPITIGRKVTISHQAHLCAGSHDYTRADFPLLKLPIQIGDEAWICADAFIGPGVTIGNKAIVAARGVAMKDVKSGLIVAGNPAVPIKSRAG